MAKITRIFNVEYYIQDVFKGRRSGDPYKMDESVVAKDALEAIALVSRRVLKNRIRWQDEETEEWCVTTYCDFDPIECTLQAEA
jgi:hypothetical protein